MSLEMPSGILRIHCEKPALDSRSTVTEAAAVAKGYNTAEYLQETFFGSAKGILQTTTTESGGQVTLMTPSGPYAEEAVMVVARGPESFTIPDVPTELIYNYPVDTQTAYWNYIFASLKHFHSSNTNPNCTIVSVENCICQHSCPERRTSRTIALPHTQILRVDKEHLSDEPWSIDHLNKEQKILSRKVPLNSMLIELQNKYQEHSGSPLHNVRIQEKAPFGYTFTASNGTVEELQKNLHSHHQAYTATAAELIQALRPQNQARLIPQPSYRLFLHLEPDGTVLATVSPEFLSSAGVMEAAGVLLQRDKELEYRVPEDTKTLLFQQLVTLLTAQPLEPAGL